MNTSPNGYATTKHLASILGQTYVELIECLIELKFIRETNEGLELTSTGCDYGGILLCHPDGNEQILWPPDIIPGIRVTKFPKYLSLSAIARESHIDPSAARTWLTDAGLLEISSGKSNLTSTGISYGAAYKVAEKGNRYIVWPPNFSLAQFIPENIASTYPELGANLTHENMDNDVLDNTKKAGTSIPQSNDSTRPDEIESKRIEQKSQSTYSVDMVLAAVVNKISGILPSYPIKVRGTLGKVNTNYDRWIFASLHGSDSKVSLKIPKANGCPASGSVVTATGIIQAGTSRVNGAIEVTLLGELLEFSANENLQIQQIKKRDHTQVRLNSFLEMNQGKYSRLCVAGSNTGLSDSFTAFQTIGSFPPDWVKQELNMIDQTKIISFLDWVSSNDQIDAVCFVRGGGEQKSFDVWEMPEVINKLIDIKKPFYSAIGHSTDLLLIDKVADESFTTPTAFGATAANAVQHFLKLAKMESDLEKRQSIEVELAKAQEQIVALTQEKNSQAIDLHKRIASADLEAAKKNEFEIEAAKLKEQLYALQQEKLAASESIQKRIEELEVDRNNHRDNSGKYYEAITKLLSERSSLDERLNEMIRQSDADRIELTKMKAEKSQIESMLAEQKRNALLGQVRVPDQGKNPLNMLLLALIVIEAIALIIVMIYKS